jgi:hypothetical protein
VHNSRQHSFHIRIECTTRDSILFTSGLSAQHEACLTEVNKPRLLACKDKDRFKRGQRDRAALLHVKLQGDIKAHQYVCS